MAVTHGKDAIFKTGTASSESDISTYIKSVDFPRKYNKADTSTLGVAFETSIPGQYSSDVKVSGPWSPALDTIMAALDGVVGKSVVYGPQGSTTSNVKYSATGWWEYNPPKADNGSALQWDAVFHVSSAITVGVF